MKWLLLCLVICACAAFRGQQTYLLKDAEVLFGKFIVDYNRHYADEQEKQTRFEIFKQNLMKVNALNDKQGGNEVFGITKFSDYTVHELSNVYGFRQGNYSMCKIITDADIPDADAPDSWDWRDHKVVTVVKNQGHCCASYAFSVTGNIEGQYAIKYKQQLLLSEEQIIDCSWQDYETNVCGGGSISDSIRYLIDNGGIEKETDYQYREGNPYTCRFNKSKIAVKITDCNSYILQSQDKLKQLLYKYGPISVALDADYLIYYVNRVIKDCRPMKMNHAMLLVGYGTDPADGDYWLLKNSWGPDHGEKGYYRIERGEGKLSCGIISNNFTVSAVIA